MSTAAFTPEADAPRSLLAGHLQRAENLLLTFVLAALVALPLAEAVLRKLIHAGIAGSAGFVQHLTLIVTMLGAAAAARDGRLLTLFEFASFASPRVRALCRAIGHWGAAIVSALLIVASLQFVASERAAGTMLSYGIPLWIVQLVLPVGFFVIMLRLLWRAGTSTVVRIMGVALLVAVFACAPFWQ